MSEKRYCPICKKPIESNQSRVCLWTIDKGSHYVHRKCAEAPRPQDPSGSAEFNCSVTGFDVVDAQVKANNMTDILLDGTPQGLVNLRGAITTAIMEAYKLGQQNK